MSPQPRVIGRYAIQAEVASGGMATVHYGRLIGPAGFSRAVAVKRLHPQFAKDPDFVAMFLDEARLASRIRHPNVVSILDVVTEAGELFLVMDFVQGEPLSKLIRAEPRGVPVPYAVSMVVGMLEGLHAAHEARGQGGEALAIVHRDVSPQNVLVGIDGLARLIDFGVAKAVGNARVTREGQLKGKIAYMAPEQILAEPIDRRADIYAASVVLWEALTGRRFFGGAESDAALVHLALTGRVDPPSAHRPEIPPELDRVLLKGLARRREDRFATAREMAQELERVVPLAAQRDVGRWVESVVGSVVRQRAERLSLLEISAVTALPISQAPSSHERASTSAAPGPPSDGVRPESGRTDLPTLSVSAPEPPPSRAQSSRPRVAVISAIVAAAIAGFYLARLMPGAPPVPIAPLESAREAHAAEAVQLPTARAEEPIRAVASSPAPIPSAAPIATSSAARGAPRPARSARPAARKAPVRPAVAPSCNPPWFVTSDGVRQYKPECLR